MVYRKKIGFDIPLDRWLRNDLAGHLRDYVQRRDIPFINYGYIEVLLTKYFAGKNNDSRVQVKR